MKWHKVRVVVEVLVPEGDRRYITQRGLRWWVQRCLERHRHEDYAPLNDPKVKFYSNVAAYEKRLAK